MKKLSARLITVSVMAMSMELASTPSQAVSQAWDPDNRFSDFGYREYFYDHGHSYWVDSQGRIPVYRDRDTGEIVVPSRIITIFPVDGDSLSRECRNVYNVLGQSKQCSLLSGESRRKIAADFYRVGRDYLDSPGRGTGISYLSAGRDVRFVMGCLRRTSDSSRFVDCLNLY